MSNKPRDRWNDSRGGAERPNHGQATSGRHDGDGDERSESSSGGGRQPGGRPSGGDAGRIKRWLVLPLLVVLVSATSVLAAVKVSHFGWVDDGDHLFRSVTDPGPHPRPIGGTVTETASQARMASQPDPSVSRAPTGIVPETAGESQFQQPQAELSAPPEWVQSVSDWRGRRGSRTSELRQLRQLREENRRLLGLVTDLSRRADLAEGRHDAKLKARSRASWPAVIASLR